MRIDQLEEATTPSEMRAAIYKISRNDSLTSLVSSVADHQGLSSEDRYTMLAYQALKARNMYMKLAEEYSMCMSTTKIVVNPGDLNGA